jgi:sigma-B regulation protein RsbU (phosphoserine phosphatase)
VTPGPAPVAPAPSKAAVNSPAGPPAATVSGLRAELLDIARQESDGRRLAEKLLAVLDRLAGGGGAAIFLKADRCFRREIATPGSAFEEQVSTAPSEGWGVFLFSGGFIRWGGDEPRKLPGDEEIPTLLVALASATRELVLRRQLKRQDFEAKTRGVQLEALYEVGLAIAGALDLDRLCEEILMRSVSLSDARRGALYLAKGSTLELKGVFGGGAPERLSTDTLVDLKVLAGAEHVLAVPVESDGATKGLLIVGDKESRTGVGPFSDADRRTLELLATQAAIALENLDLHQAALDKQRLEREIELASEIQRQILPKGTPEIPGFELTGWNRSARHIGGDYYDFFRLAPHGSRAIEWGLVLGDVSGKGVPAALLVSTLHSSLRLLLDRVELGSDLFARLNEHILASSSANKFITLLAARLDVETGDLVYLNAGHNPGIIVRRDGAVVQMGPGGLPLGLLPKMTFRAERLKLEPGDLLCLYSDGITEATSPADVEYGFDRLAALLGEAAREPLGEVVRRIELEVTAHAAGLPQGDDQTLLLLRRTI